MSGVRRSLVLSLADSYLALILQLATTVIVSRLLTPTEVGVFAISAVFMALASMFRDFGVAEYLIQEREPTPEKIRAAMAMNIIVSWGMAFVLAASAPFLADFYRETAVRDVMLVQALNLMMVPFGAVTMAWFRRELRYAPIIIANALGGISAAVVSVVLAWAGHGTMSLAWGSFAGVAATVLASMWFRPEDFPRWPGLAGIGRVFHFGKFASVLYIAGQLGKGMPELIIGRVQTAAAVGMFSRANGIVEMYNRLLMRPVMNVCLPYFAHSDRESGALRSAYMTSVSLLTAAGWPFLGCLGVAAYAAIRIVYGDQWLEAVPLAQTLCAAAAVELIHALSREALVARGDVRRANTLQLQLVAVQVCGLAMGVRFGLSGAAWGLLGAAVLGLALSQWHLRRALGLTVVDMVLTCWKSAAVASAVTLPLAVVAHGVPLDGSNYLHWGVTALVSSLVVWACGLRLLGHRLWFEIAAVIRNGLRRASAANPSGS